MEETGRIGPAAPEGGSGALPKANLLHRFVAKCVDALAVAVLSILVPPVGLWAGVVYLLIADGFWEGRSVGKRLIGLQAVVLTTRAPCAFRESVIRNLFLAMGLLAVQLPYVGWPILVAIVSIEGLLVIGNQRGQRLGDELARTQVLDAEVRSATEEGTR